MLGDFSWDASHVRGAACKDIGVGAEEVDEHHFLFIVEGSTDLQRLAVGGLWVKGGVLGTLGGLDVAHVPLLGVHGLLGHSLQSHS